VTVYSDITQHSTVWFISNVFNLRAKNELILLTGYAILYYMFLAYMFLGAFAKLRKAAISFVVPDCPSVSAWNSSVLALCT
jgi:hypothetical protein